MPWLYLLLFIQRPRSLKIGLVNMRTTQRQVVVVVNMDTIAAIHPLPVAAFPGSGILTPAVCNLLPFLATFTNLCCIPRDPPGLPLFSPTGWISSTS